MIRMINLKAKVASSQRELAQTNLSESLKAKCQMKVTFISCTGKVLSITVNKIKFKITTCAKICCTSLYAFI